ncbi:hypothetical protein [Desulfovibrio oxyclinae]|uniref:hypothetical protein n=1 Tax=Desulfovibrio oxyclinae TaxID=63560 RepID=UPI00036D05F9|nr:hypothetical protein [Desulfovibrio oxyclinae]
MPTHHHTPKLNLTELRRGWMDLTLVTPDRTCEYSVASVFSEPLKDLCDCLVDAAEYSERDGDGPWHFEFEWLGEGWLYAWEVRPEGDLLHVSTNFAGSRVLGDRPSLVWHHQTVLDRTELAQAVWNLGAQILRRHGIVGYRSLWGRDFPLAQLLQLHQSMKGDMMHGWCDEIRLLGSICPD